jgi:hydroxypyruvate reductase 1
VTKELPGERWLEVLARADAMVEYGTESRILGVGEIEAAIGDRCDGVIGQLTEKWGEELFAALQRAGGIAYSNYAVGYDNIDLEAATRKGIPVGNTPGVLTETTAEMAVALTFAVARKIPEADLKMRSQVFEGWLPTLFLGELLSRKTVGIIGAGRIGAAYARMMAEGFKMDVIYFDVHPNPGLEEYLANYSTFLTHQGEAPIKVTRATSAEEVLEHADVVSLHPLLDASTHHLINATRLSLMKPSAILINTARGPVIDEPALVEHCRQNPDFKAGLDVFEHEPQMATGLSDLRNVVVAPHIASATSWTREGMATLAASNVAAMLQGWPVSNDPKIILDFLGADAPKAAPSILNAEELGLATL